MSNPVPMTERLESMLAAGQDSPLLRFGLGNAYLQADNPEAALPHLQSAVAQDAEYSAAWKLLGKAQQQLGYADAAANSWAHGIDCALKKGDMQAAKEMQVFLKRLNKAS